jgi:hypothetical protein
MDMHELLDPAKPLPALETLQAAVNLLMMRFVVAPSPQLAKAIEQNLHIVIRHPAFSTQEETRALYRWLIAQWRETAAQVLVPPVHTARSTRLGMPH